MLTLGLIEAYQLPYRKNTWNLQYTFENKEWQIKNIQPNENLILAPRVSNCD